MIAKLDELQKMYKVSEPWVVGMSLIQKGGTAGCYCCYTISNLLPEDVSEISRGLC